MEKNQSKTAIFIVIIITQFLIISWLIYDKVNTKQETVVLISQLETSKTEKDSLVTELGDLYSAYEDLETNNKEMNEKLQAERAKIEQLMEELKKTKSSDSYRIAKYKEEIETLKNIMKSYIVQIDELNQKNQQLIAENEEIKSNYENVVTEKEELVEKTDSLANKVEIAAELQAYNVSFEALNKRGKTTKRIKKAEKFQLCYTLNKNKITKQGNKDVYIRIADNAGNIIRNTTSGFFEYQGKEIAYSAKKNILYKGEELQDCMYYNIQNEDLPKGTFTVFIFIDGKEIASKELILK